LIIEDDPKIRRTIVETLTAAGHVALEAKDGREGLNLFNIHRPTMVITDIVMPNKDGFETIGELRRMTWKGAIIAMSDSDAPRTELYLGMAIDLGADAAVEKPFSDMEILDLVDKLL
jgi:DNA-binding response OmpR family regulator